MSKRIALLATAVTAAAGLAVSAATASPKKHARQDESSHLLVGINDEAFTPLRRPDDRLRDAEVAEDAGHPRQPLLGRDEVGGREVAARRPERPRRPRATTGRSTTGSCGTRRRTTSRSSSRSSSRRAGRTAARRRTVAPTNFKDLENFAYAAAERYSGLWTPPPWQQDPSNPTTKLPLPKVSMWTAWNEPNNPIWLTPQYKRVGKTWRVESAFQYAKICNAVYNGVHSPIPRAAAGRAGRVRRHRAEGQRRAGDDARVGRSADVPHAGAQVRHEDASTSTRTIRMRTSGSGVADATCRRASSSGASSSATSTCC